MGFSGGGSNILKPHTHNGLTVLDGGALDFNNITQSQSTAGMVFFSDGTHLQQLAYPGSPAGETLTAVAASTAPSWAAAASGGSWSEQGNDINTVKGTSLDVTVTDADVYQVLYNVASGGDQSAPVLAMRLNDVTTSSYQTLAQWGTGGSATESEARTKTKWLCSIGGGDDGYNGCAYVYKSDSNFAADSQGGATFVCNTQQISSTAPLYVIANCGANTSVTSAITKITLVVMNENDDDNAQIVGSMRVNSLSYS